MRRHSSVVHLDEYDRKEYDVSDNDQDDDNAPPLQCDDLLNPSVSGPRRDSFDTSMIRWQV